MAARGHDLRALYDRHAEAFDRHRHKIGIERPWLDRALAIAPSGTAVLDLGCGAGAPIFSHLVASGRDVVGVDYSPRMLALARARFPDASLIEQDMRALALERRFGLIVAWDSFFHLEPDEQRRALGRIAHHLEPAGALLLTCGPEAGEVTGTVEGEAVYHASLDRAEYVELLDRAGVDLVDFVAEDPDCDGHSVLLAQRRGDD